ncbi:hypothetical protein GW17_00016286, partial [Ensete ventricosum]
SDPDSKRDPDPITISVLYCHRTARISLLRIPTVGFLLRPTALLCVYLRTLHKPSSLPIGLPRLQRWRRRSPLPPCDLSCKGKQALAFFPPCARSPPSTRDRKP